MEEQKYKPTPNTLKNKGKTVGVFTVHRAFNYGALLQAIATQWMIEKLGYKVKFINFFPKSVEKENKNHSLLTNAKGIAIYLYLQLNLAYNKRLQRFKDFRNKLKVTKRYFSVDELYQDPPEFDIYLAGSDQIWNLENGVKKHNFLDFIPNKGSRKVSFASSFGTKQIPAKHKSDLKKLLTGYHAISVREIDGVNIIKDATGMNVEQVLDPTLMMSADQWAKTMSSDKAPQEDYILIYALNNDERSVELLEAVRKRYGMPVYGIPMGIKVPSKFKVDKEIQDAGPAEFIYWIKHAKVICTSSFHGLAFSINLGKTFYTVPHPTRNSRLNSLLSSLGLTRRQEFNPLTIEDLNDSELFMDYKEIHKSLAELRKESLSFIETALA